MKKIILLFLLFIFAFSCNNDEPEVNKPLEINGKLTYNSECKSFDGMIRNPITPDNLSCIEYEFDADNNRLTLRHINTAFNCCPGTISCGITSKNDTIFITESEQKSNCDCDCLYDLDIEINGVTATQYFLQFDEPYLRNQEVLDFQLDLSKNTQGENCVQRTKYPWGIN